MKTINELAYEPIGKILEKAGLINTGQIEVALAEQKVYPDLRLGEIFSFHGWLKQETADFFAEQIKQLDPNTKISFIEYCCQAGLLSHKQIEQIEELLSGIGQIKSDTKFSLIALQTGLLKQKTVDFFFNYFIAQQKIQKAFDSIY